MYCIARLLLLFSAPEACPLRAAAHRLSLSRHVRSALPVPVMSPCAFAVKRTV
jgi:hypothetical protein